MTETISGLARLAGRYDILLCDVWGVVHNGREAFPAACEALAQWRMDVGPVVLISNAPRPEGAVATQLDSLGVPRTAWTAIVTSGDVSRELLAARAPGPAWRIGPAKDDPLFVGLGLEFTGPDEATFIACSGPQDEETETPEDYRVAFEAAAAKGLTMICANPDVLVQRGDRLIYCAGALAQLYRALGGQVIEAGKPYAPIYDLAIAHAEAVFGRSVDRRRVLTIGDGVSTDLAGALAQGLDALFVVDGVHAAEVRGTSGRTDPAALERLLAGAEPTFVIDSLIW
ncbi:MAG TPA: TIGR01459 family HAD-type hydrolase [Caulobacteraceae bacterium]